jgi:hypothetical protein
MSARKKPADVADLLRRSREKREARELAARASHKDQANNPDRWGEAPKADELATLKRTGAEVALDRLGRVKFAHRGDVFHQLAGRDAITPRQHQAIRRLEADIAERLGVGGKGEALDVIDGGSAGGAQGYTQRQVDAGKRVDAILAMVGPPACRLLQAILEPPLATGCAVQWRRVVETITGEMRAEAQTALLRFACESLADCYDETDKRGRR